PWVRARPRDGLGCQPGAVALPETGHRRGARAGPGAGGGQRLPPARHGAVGRDRSPVPCPDPRGGRDAPARAGHLARPARGPALRGEILRAKTVGAVWKARWTAGTILGLWSIGLMAGAVHPLGFLAAVLGLGVLSWSHAALGTSVALWSRTRNQANNRV